MFFIHSFRGGSIDAVDSEQKTPLHLAAYKGHASAVEYLLEKGADMELKDEDGNHPIHLAADEGQYK